MLIFQLIVIVLVFSGFKCRSCKARNFGQNYIVCVCNETYCDDLVLQDNIPPQQAIVYETNRNGARFESFPLKFSTSPLPGVPMFKINNTDKYQFILGFGGAFTDASGINIKSLPTPMQDSIMSSYFAKTGLQYNMGRVPIASCDFSTHPYSYDDVVGDLSLKYFQLAKEDFMYKIPFIKKAAGVSKDNLLLFGSPWSSPGWMKTNNAMNGKGELKGNPGGKYYQTWANYFVRFLEAYRENNVTFWGLTLQNEPTDGCQANFSFQSMCFPPEKQRDFLKLHLGPSLQKAGFGPDNLKLMILDDLRFMLPRWAEVILQDKSAAQYVSGIAFHWYLGSFSPYKLLDITHSKFPDVFFLATEACTGSYPWDFPKVSLGNWKRAERYAYDVIQDLLNWSIGWIDWNIALDMEGGPNWVKNYVDSPIIINSSAKEFYKQPMYYALAQFSKCLPRGSFRIGLETEKFESEVVHDIDIAAFQTPTDRTVVITVNRKDNDVKLVLHDATKGYLNVISTAHSIQSYVW